MKYNYMKASMLWDRLTQYYDLRVATQEEIQVARRDFLHCLTRNQDGNIYTDFLKDELENLKPYKGAKSRCYDFKEEKKIIDLIIDINNFTN